MITPERVKEIIGGLVFRIDAYKKTDEGYFSEYIVFEQDIINALHHYAEILPKYQALLEAEPVGEIVLEDYGAPFSAIRVVTRYKECPPVGTQLIIKPKGE